MADIDRILKLIDEGLLAHEQQHTDEPNMAPPSPDIYAAWAAVYERTHPGAVEAARILYHQRPSDE